MAIHTTLRGARHRDQETQGRSEFSINQSTNQSINQSINQPINCQSIVNQSIHPSINQWLIIILAPSRPHHLVLTPDPLCSHSYHFSCSHTGTPILSISLHFAYSHFSFYIENWFSCSQGNIISAYLIQNLFQRFKIYFSCSKYISAVQNLFQLFTLKKEWRLLPQQQLSTQ